jgi:hypothetical protein
LHALLARLRHVALRRLRTTLVALAVLRGARRLARTHRCFTFIKPPGCPGRRCRLSVANRGVALALRRRSIRLPALTGTKRGALEVLRKTACLCRRAARIVTTHWLPG